MSDAHKILTAFVEANSDIYRNREDQRLLKDSTVKYVFDADIFDLFVRPMYYLTKDSGHLQKSRAFSVDWGMGFDKQNEDSSRDLYSQHALLMSEHLMSGTLPGSDRCFYFTPWHASEIDQSFQVFNANFSHKRSSLKNHLERMTDTYINIVENNDSKVQAMKAVEIMADLTRTLAQDSSVEPIEQMGRFRGKVRDNSKILTDALQINDHEIAFIAFEARNIFRDMQLKFGSDRTEHSIRNDSYSIATIDFLNKKHKDQNIIFITGDNALFEFYRDWYYGEKTRDSIFFFRRYAQYNPTLNTRSAESDFYSRTDEVSRFFESISSLIYGVIVRHVLRNHPESLEDHIYADKNRFQWLAWGHSKPENETSMKRVLMVPAEIDQIFYMRDKIRKIQENISGTFSKYSSNRLSKKIKKFILLKDRKNFIESVKGFIDEYLEDLDDSSIKLFDGADNIRLSFLYGLKPGPHRTPDTLLYEINGETLSALVKRLNETSNQNNGLPTSFSIISDIHACASAVALSRRCWSEAEYYAIRSRALHKINHARHELDFLVCVTKRFSLADQIGKNLSRDEAGEKEITKRFQVIALQLERISPNLGLRFQSELAALQLFITQTMLVFKKYEEASESIKIANDNLCLCIDEISRKKEHHSSVRGQVAHNFAASLLLASLIGLYVPNFSAQGFSRKRIEFALDNLGPLPQHFSKFLELERVFFNYFVSSTERDAAFKKSSFSQFIVDAVSEENGLSIDVILCNDFFHELNDDDYHRLKNNARSYIYDSPRMK